MFPDLYPFKTVRCKLYLGGSGIRAPNPQHLLKLLFGLFCLTEGLIYDAKPDMREQVIWIEGDSPVQCIYRLLIPLHPEVCLSKVVVDDRICRLLSRCL